MKKLMIVQAAALGAELLRNHRVDCLGGYPVHALEPVAPAVTCTAQATLRTAMAPDQHQMFANGLFLRETYQSVFWSHSAKLVRGERIWDAFRAQGGRVGMYFFQQSLGEAVDEVVTPAPIHCHGGRMMMATYQQPQNVMACENPVPLWRYWGPLASPKAGREITNAIVRRMLKGDTPELMLIYLPTLDYELQRHGTSHPKVAASVRELTLEIAKLSSMARIYGYEFAVAGDYAITNVTGTVAYPNQLLRQAGFFAVRPIHAMRYPDFFRSRAVALCDHQCALIYCLDATCRDAVRKLLATLPEVAEIRDGAGDVDFELVAKPGCWFAWRWWDEPQEAPDYATHVDIHNKPGFDPCELFFGRTAFSISTDVSRIKGTHGRADAPVAMATSFPCAAKTAIEMAQELKRWLGMPETAL
ncbi:MAG: alkaline phosphatase family protein [Kiritimatiellia bacterium]